LPPCHHGSTTKLVLSRLVNTGQRQQAIDALRSAMFASDLPLLPYGQLRALLAWGDSQRQCSGQLRILFMLRHLRVP
jgi:hypothetical protein